MENRLTGRATVKLDLVPSLIKPHGHGTDEWLDTGRGLQIGVKHISTKWQLDSKRLWLVFAGYRTANIARRDVRAHDLQNTGLNILV
eukprot:scaffold461565_cov52-Prasinocladus_malaysianus.AAC.1